MERDEHLKVSRIKKQRQFRPPQPTKMRALKGRNKGPNVEHLTAAIYESRDAILLIFLIRGAKGRLHVKSAVEV